MRLDDDLSEWVEEEAERRDRSKAYVVSEAIEAHRSESHQSGAERTDEHTTAPKRANVERLESRLTEVEKQLQKLTDAPPADGRSGDETPTPDAPKTGMNDTDVVVEWVRENQPAGRAEIVAEFHDADAMPVNEKTYWENYARPALKEAGFEFVRNQGWQELD